MATKRPREKRPQPMTVPARPSPAANAAAGAPKLRRLHIQGYKAIDELVLDVPAPRMPGDPDILVIGSKNGVGKTSVLEVIALAVFATQKVSPHDFQMPEPLMDLMVRAGEHAATIDARFGGLGGAEELRIAIRRGVNLMQFEGERFAAAHVGRFAAPPGKTDLSFPILLGQEVGPLLAPPLLYFHSYRKVLEGSVEIGDILASSPAHEERRQTMAERAERATSPFKVELLRALMKRAGLFEDTAPAGNGEDLDRLNHLMGRFAGGAIEKLRPSRDNSLDLRVSP